MNFTEVIKECQLEESYVEILIKGWDESAKTQPSTLPFLEKSQIKESREYCRMAESLDEVLFDCASTIDSNPFLKAMIWHCYYQLFISQEADNLSSWPAFKALLGDNHGVFYLLVALGMIPDVKEKYRSMEIPESIIQDTCLEVNGFCSNHISVWGSPGIDVKQIQWLRNYKNGKLFRLGRFEYKLEQNHLNCRILKHRTQPLTLALAKDGCVYDTNGFSAYADTIEQDGNWTATFSESSDYIEGYPISPDGRVIQEKTKISLSEWELLSEDISAIDMHIPPGGGMSPEVCIDSFNQAKAFFKKYFSGQYEELFICNSWIFDTQIEENLPNSNLSKLMRELYLIPQPSSGTDAVFFVFGKEYKPEVNLPRDTSLQRVILDTLDNGGRMRATGMILFADDLSNFGSQYYRKKWYEIKSALVKQ